MLWVFCNPLSFSLFADIRDIERTMFILTTFKLMRSNSKILCHNFQLDINTFKYCCW